MKKLVIFSFLFLVNITIVAQLNQVLTRNDTIRILNNNQGVTYYRAGEKLDYKRLSEIFSKNKPENTEFMAYDVGNKTGTVLAVIGVGFTAYGCIALLKENNVAPLAIGLGSFVAFIPVTIVSKVHLLNAIKIYNNSIMRPDQKRISLNFGVSSNGLGFQLKF